MQPAELTVSALFAPFALASALSGKQQNVHLIAESSQYRPPESSRWPSPQHFCLLVWLQYPVESLLRSCAQRATATPSATRTVLPACTAISSFGRLLFCLWLTFADRSGLTAHALRQVDGECDRWAGTAESTWSLNSVYIAGRCVLYRWHCPIVSSGDRPAVSSCAKKRSKRRKASTCVSTTSRALSFSRRRTLLGDYICIPEPSCTKLLTCQCLCVQT
jgi:hypothetical protein